MDATVDPLDNADTDAARAYAEERKENIRTFVRTNPDYYIRNFDIIGASARFTPTFNQMAGLFGPIWFGARGLWSWALPFLIIETLAVVQIARGLFGDLAADANARIASIEGTLELRRQQLAAAIENGSDRVEAFRRTVESLEANIGGIRAEAQALADQGIWIALTGLAILVIAKLVQATVANWALEARFSDWLSDRSIRSGMPQPHMIFSAVFVVLIMVIAMVHYSFPGRFGLLTEFPTHPDIRLTGIAWVEDFIAFCVRNSEAFFDGLTLGIRSLLDALEIILVQTPWIVIASLIVLVTWLSAGVRVAIFSGAFLAYMGLLGFWESGDDHPGAAGHGRLPLHRRSASRWACTAARRPRFYAVIQPIMDFMQTMPAFVFMVPVIAFFGVGKPAAVIVTMIFGGTPVVAPDRAGLARRAGACAGGCDLASAPPNGTC